MRFPGFIGPAYTLDSVNVEAQACINLYPEQIQSQTGKEHEVAYLRATPGLTNLVQVGSGPIRCVHVDSIGRIFVVSGNQLYSINRGLDWTAVPTTYAPITASQSSESSDLDPSAHTVTHTAHGFYTGLKVQLSSTGVLPTGLAASTDYWIIVSDANTFKFASSLANALSATVVAFSAKGSGILTIAPQIPFNVFGTGTGDIDFTADTFIKASHGFYTGLKIQFTFLGASIGGVSTLTNYFVIDVDADSFTVASSLANASSGTPHIDLTSGGGNVWAATLIGASGEAGGSAITFLTSTVRVKAASMSFGGTGTDSSTVFVDGAKMMLFLDNQDGTSSFGALATFTDPISSALYSAVDTASDITWIDGYFLIVDGGTNKFFASDLKSFNFDALEFGTAEGSPDILLAVEVSYRNLCLFAQRSTEIFADTGNANFPFERIQGGFIEIGTVAQYSIAKADEGTVLWLGRSDSGQGIVYAAQGLTPQRVSTHAIEQAISGYADPSAATAFTYQSNGHMFYVLNFAEATWVYDLSTGMWHQRAYTNSGVLERHRADFCAFAWEQGIHIVGDYSNNKIYQLDDSVFADDGAAITRLRSSPHTTSDLNRVFCSKFQLDMEVGIGLVAGQGSNPTVMFDFSDDGGHTFSSESFALADAGSGQIGAYRTRVMWRRLGSFRDRIFRVKITDPVKVRLLGANLDVEPGAN